MDTVDEAIERAGAESTAEQWAYRGMCLLGLKRYADALESCDFVITLNPNYNYAYTWRGNALSDLKRYEEALASYDRAIELGSEYAQYARSRTENLLRQARRTVILQEAFSMLPVGKIIPSDNADMLFHSILSRNETQDEWPTRLSDMLMRFADLGEIGWVGQELTKSLVGLFASSLSVETVEAWNTAWQEAGKP